MARTSQDTVHCSTCLALTRLRRGSDQQPCKVTQCSSSKPKSLAYNSVKMRCGLALLHVSIFPSCFHSFQSSSICQRKRIKATTCRAESTRPSTLVSTSSHSTCRCLLTLTLWRFLARFRGWRPGPGLARRPQRWTPRLAGTPLYLTLGSFLASSHDLFRQTQGDQAHRHLSCTPGPGPPPHRLPRRPWMRTPLSLAPDGPPEPRHPGLNSLGRLTPEPSCKKPPPAKCSNSGVSTACPCKS